MEATGKKNSHPHTLRDQNINSFNNEQPRDSNQNEKAVILLCNGAFTVNSLLVVTEGLYCLLKCCCLTVECACAISELQN